MTVAKVYGWSLHDIDETDVESLLNFVRYANEKHGTLARKQVFCDQVDWL